MGYGALLAAGLGGLHDDEDEDDDVSSEDLDDSASRWERIWQRWVVDLWVHPKHSAVKRIASKWWSRYGLLVFLPAILVCLLLETLPIRARGYTDCVPLDGRMVFVTVPPISAAQPR